MLPPRPLPCPPRPSRKGTRIATSPAPPCVCSKAALVLFPPAGAGCSVGCHSPWQLAIITAILQSRLSAAVLGGPQVPPRQGQCHPPALDQAHIRRRRRPLVSLPLAHDRQSSRGGCLHDDARCRWGLRSILTRRDARPAPFGTISDRHFPKAAGAGHLTTTGRRMAGRADHPVGHAAVVVPGLHAAEGGRAVAIAVGVGAR